MDDPYPSTPLSILGIFNPELASISYLYLYGTLLFLILLVFCSSLFSASENALFSLNAKEKEDMKALDSASGNAVLKLLSQPKKLLATILVGNNFVNVTFVIVSSVWMESILNKDIHPYLDFRSKGLCQPKQCSHFQNDCLATISLSKSFLFFSDSNGKVYDHH
jgi:hypothetical protein